MTAQVPTIKVSEGDEDKISGLCRDGNIIDLEGYYQKLEYVENASAQLRRILRISKQQLSTAVSEFPQLKSRNVVTLHVRRGDYVKLRSWYNLLETQYYVMALALIKDFDEIIAVSDDRAWVDEILIPAIRRRFIGVKIRVSSGESFLHDFVLLHSGKYIILANSTFSWWAAYLHTLYGRLDRDVYAPDVWFNETGPYAEKNLQYTRGKFFPRQWTLLHYSGSSSRK